MTCSMSMVGLAGVRQYRESVNLLRVPGSGDALTSRMNIIMTKLTGLCNGMVLWPSKGRCDREKSTHTRVYNESF